MAIYGRTKPYRGSGEDAVHWCGYCGGEKKTRGYHPGYCVEAAKKLGWIE